MEWFFEKRGKSVASNAQRIVADMHKHLDAQTKKAKEMEAIMLKFKELNINSLEREILRLQKRKQDLLSELDETEKSLNEATTSLSSLQERMELALQLPVPDLTTGLNQKSSSINEISSHNNSTSTVTSSILPAIITDIKPIVESKQSIASPSIELTSSPPSNLTSFAISTPKTNTVENTSIESTDTMVQKTLKEIHPKHLFYIHQNKVDSIIIFIATLRQPNLIDSLFLSNANDKEGRELTVAEDSMYGVRIVPNHQRDFPHVAEMPCPKFLLKDSSSANPKMGTLIGAFEIALTSAVVVDAWQTSDGLIWATTTVDGHSFAILERMYVVSEVSWGLQSIVQVDLYGRDESSGNVIVEHVSAHDDDQEED